MPSKDALRKTIMSIIEKEFRTELELNITTISNPGENYTAALFSATASAPEKQLEIFVKVCVVSADLDISQLFKIEHRVYTQLARIFEELQDKHQICEQRYVFPKYYGYYNTDEEPIMVMENLTARGYQSFDRLKSIDWEYAAKSIEALARFHALSFSYCKERREEFQNVDKVLEQPVWLDGERYQCIIDGAVEVVDEKDREKVAAYLEGSAGWSKLLKFTEARKTAVIIHGDYRPNNIMYRRVNGQLEVMPVDYQVVRLGCPASDLLYFIVLGSDQQFRERHFQQLINHYYDQLKLSLARLGLEAEQVYGRGEFDDDLREKLTFGLYVGAMLLPIVLVTPEEALRAGRGGLAPPRSELFAERYRDLARDWVRWGII